MKILIASNNEGKWERFSRLLSNTDPNLQLLTPKMAGIIDLEVEENASTLLDNAELKARAYEGRTSLPILANDTGFFVAGEGFVSAPKRAALGSVGEHKLSRQEASERLVDYWKEIAAKHGGEVDAAWVEGFVVLYPDGSIRRAESRREVILTDQEYAPVPEHMPMRALYRSKVTGKPAILHTPEEEIIEMQPIILALQEVLGR